MSIRRIDPTYIKTTGANTKDILRINSGNLSYTAGNTIVIEALYGLAGDNITIAANGKISSTSSGTVTQANLTTGNVVELASSGNLYFSNARVKDSISNQLLGNATFGGDVVATGVFRSLAQGGDEGGQIELGNALTNSTLVGPVNIDVYQNRLRIFESGGTNRGVYVDLSSVSTGVGTNLIGAGSGTITQVASITSGVVSNAELASGITSSGLLTTANIVETSNLYYTNTRVYSNTIALLPTLAGDNITIAANGRISSTSSGSVTQANLTTANVVELASSGNLYYTNSRTYSNVIALLPTYTGNLAVGNLVATSGAGGSITGANLMQSNVFSGNIWTGIYTANVLETSSNLYYTNARVYSNVVSLLSNYTGDLAGGNVYATNAMRTNSIHSNVWQSLYSANVVESDTKLFYTNARVRSTLSGGTGVVYDTTAGTIAIGQNVATTATVTFANLVVTGQVSIYGNVTTYSSNNLAISDNMIYLNNGSQAANPDLGIAGNYNDGSYKHTGFFRDATDGSWKVFDSYTPEPDASQFIDTTHASFRLANLQANVFFGSFSGNGSAITGLNTTAIAEGGNLYYTNARVNSNILALLPTLAGDNITIAANGRISAAASSNYGNSNVISLLTTLAGDNITIEANGRISSTGSGSTTNVTAVISIDSSNTYTGGTANLTLPSSVTNSRDVIVTIDGLVQIPSTDYYVNGTTLAFTSTPPANSTVEAKVLRNATLTHSSIQSLVLHPFLLMGA